MANAHQLIDCFNDTMHRIQTDPFLRAETMKSKADTVVYPVFWDNNQAAYFAKWLYFDSCDVEVVADTTFSAARKYLRNGNEKKRVAVLNFANPHYAGGGVEHGAMAQEECLCRSSNLYPCLFAPCAPGGVLSISSQSVGSSVYGPCGLYAGRSGFQRRSAGAAVITQGAMVPGGCAHLRCTISW